MDERKYKGRVKMEIKENARTFGDDDDENEKWCEKVLRKWG